MEPICNPVLIMCRQCIIQVLTHCSNQSQMQQTPSGNSALVKIPMKNIWNRDYDLL